MAKVSKDYINGCRDMLNKFRYLIDATEIQIQKQPLNIRQPQEKLLRELASYINTTYVSQVEKLENQINK